MNYKLLVEYDGTRYNGWQKQGNTKDTIQGKIEEVLSKMQGEEVEVHGAGRTDAGVHARGQTANVHLNTEKSCGEIKDYLNRYLPDDIGILEVSEAAPRFHSRLNAVGKTYTYRLAWDGNKHVFDRKYVTFLEEKPNVERMKEAAAFLIGEHDFKSFCANRKMKKSTVRKLYSIHFQESREELAIEFNGNGFLYNMVRILTGTLLEVGDGKRQPEDMKKILEGRDRSLAGPAAPARGLTLSEVQYTL